MAACDSGPGGQSTGSAKAPHGGSPLRDQNLSPLCLDAEPPEERCRRTLNEAVKAKAHEGDTPDVQARLCSRLQRPPPRDPSSWCCPNASRASKPSPAGRDFSPHLGIPQWHAVSRSSSQPKSAPSRVSVTHSPLFLVNRCESCPQTTPWAGSTLDERPTGRALMIPQHAHSPRREALYQR
jgi:hypothetical protein